MRIFWLFLGFFLFLSLFPQGAFAELTPNQIAILANRNSPEGLELASYYAKVRGVPPRHIIKLDLPTAESMSFELYETELVRPVREALQKRGLEKTIKVLLTTYGIPVKLRAPLPSKEETKLAASMVKFRSQLRIQLQELRTQIDRIAANPENPGGKKDAKEVPDDSVLQAEIAESVRGMHRRLAAVKDSRRAQSLGKRALELFNVLGGGSAIVDFLRATSFGQQPEKKSELERLRSESLKLFRQMLSFTTAPGQLDWNPVLRSTIRLYGVLGGLKLSNQILASLEYGNAKSSVDSELTLLWWNRADYSLAGRMLNPLHFLKTNSKGEQHGPKVELPILLVSRLDGPSVAQAKKIVDKSVEAERFGLKGKVYIDAEGRKPGATWSKGDFDQNLIATAWLFRNHTDYEVVLENTMKRFTHPGEAENAAVYVGWYKIRSYEDAFTFPPGAIGYHVTSEEAVSLRDPNEAGWCKNALERGVSVTLGATREPYLDSFPLPYEFFGLLLSGRYSLAEVYFLTTRYLSWHMTLVGDPLYNPWKDKEDKIEWKDLEKEWSSDQKIVEFPKSPLRWTFKDILLKKEALRKSRIKRYKVIPKRADSLAKNIRNMLQGRSGSAVEIQ